MQEREGGGVLGGLGDSDFKYGNWPDAFWLTLRLKTKENRNSDNYFRSIQSVFESNTN